mgnify:FL=1
MSKQLFRQKSLEKITSPEQMGDYIRVSNPSVWMILVAIIVLLIGVCVWGVFGRLDTTLPTGGVCKDGQLPLYISEKDFDKLGADTLVSVTEKEYALSEISESPVKLDTSYDPYLIHLMGLSEGDWVYIAKADAPEIKDGTYSVEVITERIKPIDFVRN